MSVRLQTRRRTSVDPAAMCISGIFATGRRQACREGEIEPLATALVDACADGALTSTVCTDDVCMLEYCLDFKCGVMFSTRDFWPALIDPSTSVLFSALEWAGNYRSIMVYDWDDKQATCYRLYVVERKNLDDVMKFFRDEGA
jgi:hypothetical protein